MLIVATDLKTRCVPDEIAKAAGTKPVMVQHWRVVRRLRQWAEWMDRCEENVTKRQLLDWIEKDGEATQAYLSAKADG